MEISHIRIKRQANCIFFETFINSILTFHSMLTRLAHQSIKVLLLTKLTKNPISYSFRILYLPLRYLRKVFH
jgi:hypothetical protein